MFTSIGVVEMVFNLPTRGREFYLWLSRFVKKIKNKKQKKNFLVFSGKLMKILSYIIN